MDFGGWLQIVGTLLAASIGVVGLWVVLTREQAERRRARMDEALADVMRALGARSADLDEWLDRDIGMAGTFRITLRGMPDLVGGPTDAPMQTAIDIAWMNARGPERVVLSAIGTATFSLKLGRVTWQQAIVGEIVGDIRKWRTGEFTDAQMIESMQAIEKFAMDSRDDIKSKMERE
jgi:hypothetical protein